MGELGQALEHLRAELVPSPLVRDIHKNHNWKMGGRGRQRDAHSFPIPPNFQGMGSGQPHPPKLPGMRDHDHVNWASDAHPEPNPDQQIPCSSTDLPTKRAPNDA